MYTPAKANTWDSEDTLKKYILYSAMWDMRIKLRSSGLAATEQPAELPLHHSKKFLKTEVTAIFTSVGKGRMTAES